MRNSLNQLIYKILSKISNDENVKGQHKKSIELQINNISVKVAINDNELTLNANEFQCTPGIVGKLT